MRSQTSLWHPFVASAGLALAATVVIAAVPMQDRPPSAAAVAYLDEALGVMQAHFLHKEAIDWPALRAATIRQAGSAETAVDTYPAVRFALATLDDHHSYLQLTPALTAAEAARKPALADPAAMPAAVAHTPSFPYPSPFRTRRVPEGAMVAGTTRPIAQVVVPLFASPNRQDLDAFATSLQTVIRSLVAESPCGWIVDLRGNGGGNVWAMLAGIGPLLGDVPLGGALDATGVTTTSFYRGGAVGSRTPGGEETYATAAPPAVVVSGRPPLAVLIDRETGSSAEGIAIAFRGRPDTRFFGETTFGAATSTFPYPLSDGAQIYLVTAVMVDNHGHEYPAGIDPDEEILSEATISNHDPVITAAATWLIGRPGCRPSHD